MVLLFLTDDTHFNRSMVLLPVALHTCDGDYKGNFYRIIRSVNSRGQVLKSKNSGQGFKKGDRGRVLPVPPNPFINISDEVHL